MGQLLAEPGQYLGRATGWPAAATVCSDPAALEVAYPVNTGQLARPLFAVPSGTPLAEAQRRYAEAVTDDSGREPVLAVVNSSGQLIGLVDETAAAQVPAERRPWITLDAVARSLDPGRILPAELSGHALVEAVRANPGSEYVVTVGEDVLGVLRVADVVQVLEARGPSR